MRQVPNYLIIGRGRLATHFGYYFNLLGQPYSVWHRGHAKEQLQSILPQSSHVLILINDDAIEPFIHDHLQHASHAYLIHCSGHLTSSQAIGAHPLMTFSKSLYSLATYQAVPFIVDEDAPSFKALFPALNNPTVRINKQVKQKYHAICALSGGLTSYLWQQLFDRFETEFALPKEMAFPYLKQQVLNVLQDANQALTGPIVRGDQQTIQSHLHVLQQDALLPVYQAFIASFQSRST